MSKKQRERLAWLEHVLADSDYLGRFRTRKQIVAMEKELEQLRKLKGRTER